MSTDRPGVRAKLAPLLAAGGLTAMAIGAGSAGVILVILDFSSPLAAPLALVFVGLAPAAAISGLLNRFDMLARLVIAGTASVVINFLVAETMLAAGAWS